VCIINAGEEGCEQFVTPARLRSFEEGEFVKIFPTNHFGYRKITVERPLRLNFQASPKRIARLHEEGTFRNLAISERKGEAKAAEEAKGREQQDLIRTFVRNLPDKLYKDRNEFASFLDDFTHKAGLKLPRPVPRNHRLQ
jgi:type I restriction enzyme M protein